MAKLKNKAILNIFTILISMLISIETAKAQEAAAPEAQQQEDKIEYKSEYLRDPFQEEEMGTKEGPQEEQEAKPLPALSVQGIVWGGILPQAIINNKVLRVGDTIEGARITGIDKNGVTLFFDNRQYNLTPSSPAISNDSKK